MLRQPRSRLRILGYRSLEEYYESDHWKQFTIDFFMRNAVVCFCRGLGCNGDEIGVKPYHITFERIGDEAYTDVVAMCKNHRQLVLEMSANYGIRLDVAHLLIKDIVWFHNYRRRECDRYGNSHNGNSDLSHT